MSIDYRKQFVHLNQTVAGNHGYLGAWPRVATDYKWLLRSESFGRQLALFCHERNRLSGRKCFRPDTKVDPHPAHGASALSVRDSMLYLAVRKTQSGIPDSFLQPLQDHF